MEDTFGHGQVRGWPPWGEPNPVSLSHRTVSGCWRRQAGRGRGARPGSYEIFTLFCCVASLLYRSELSAGWQGEAGLGPAQAGRGWGGGLREARLG